MNHNCDFCGEPVERTGRLHQVRDWETPNTFNERRKKPLIKWLCKRCGKKFTFQSGNSVMFK